MENFVSAPFRISPAPLYSRQYSDHLEVNHGHIASLKIKLLYGGALL